MSIRFVALVLGGGPKQSSEAWVLAILADCANDQQGGVCYPSIELVAKRARLSERQTQRIIRKLAADDWLRIEEGGGRHQVNRYWLNVPRLEAEQTIVHTPTVSSMSPYGASETVTSATETVTSAAGNGDVGVTPTRTEPEEPLTFALQMEEPRAAVRVVDLFDTFWAEYPREGRVESKKATKEAWVTALKKDSPSNILAGLRRQLPYMRQQMRDGKNWNKHAKRWLSGELWKEAPPEVGPQRGQSTSGVLIPDDNYRDHKYKRAIDFDA
jgi:Helix-turn-helix domain